EDAKRAPKFTSSHSSSSSSTKQPNQRAQVKTPMEAGLINMNWEQSLSRLKAFKS
ncbi:BnaCnng58990D, partial [Brassica napus]